MRGRTFLSNTALLLASVAVGFLLLEGGSRLLAWKEDRKTLARGLDPTLEPPAEGPADLGHMIRFSEEPRIVYELKPDLRAHYQGAWVYTDAAGFRRSELPPAAGGRPLTIVGIGDSLMFGQGVAGSETYLHGLGERIRRAHPELAPRVVNTSVPGYNTVMEVATLRHKGLTRAPDLVVIEFVGNDLALPNFIRLPRPVLDPRRSFLWERLAKRWKRSRDARPTRFEEEIARHGFRPAPRDPFAGGFLSDPEAVPPRYRGMVGWEAYEEALRELRDLAGEHDFEVVWITLMQKHPIRQRAMAFAREMGFHTVDVGAYFRRYLKKRGERSYMRSELALSPEDGHPSALGHELAAQRIYAYFLRAGLLSPGPEPALPDPH